MNLGKKVGKKNENTSYIGVLFASLKNFFLASILIGSFIGFSSIITVFCYVLSVINDKDQSHIPVDLRELKLDQTSNIFVLDENGNFKESISVHGIENRTWVSLDRIPVHMRNAIIAIEDRRFASHSGVDIRRSFGAILSLLSGRNSYGGSTITQQVVKNLSSDESISLTRKIREIIRSLNLEKDYSKDEILEVYLNTVNFGSGTNGVQTASKLYFNKDISECSIAECATIAGITQLPSAYSPLLNPENNKKRTETVLSAMYEQNLILNTQYDEAFKSLEHMTFKNSNLDEGTEEEGKRDVWDWYTETLLADVKRDLVKELKINEKDAERMIYRGGLSIYSAVDEKAQATAEKTIVEFNGFSDDMIDICFYMLDPSNGRTLAIVGTRRKKEVNLPLNKATEEYYQPGSAIKPLAVYAPAVEDDICNFSSFISNSHIANYNAKNWGSVYDSKSFVTVVEALEVSMNLPAIHVLEEYGPRASIKFLREKLKFSEISEENDANLALALGGLHKGVTAREMAAGFQIFGNGGFFNEPFTYLKVVDSRGRVLLERPKTELVRVLTPQTSYIMNRILKHCVDGSNGIVSLAKIPGWEVAAKTGTTDKDIDHWLAGLTPYASGVMHMKHENPDNPGERESLKYADQRLARGLWNEIMKKYLENKQVKAFPIPDGIVTAPFCAETGLIASSPLCKKNMNGCYKAKKMPNGCSLHENLIKTQKEQQNQKNTVVQAEQQRQAVQTFVQEQEEKQKNLERFMAEQEAVKGEKHKKLPENSRSTTQPPNINFSTSHPGETQNEIRRRS